MCESSSKKVLRKSKSSITIVAWISKQTGHFHSPGSGKYPDFEAFHLFQTSATEQMWPLPAAVSTHTHSVTLTHTHWVAPAQAAPCSLVLFWLRRPEGGTLPKYGEQGGGTFRIASQSAGRSRQTVLRVTHVRDSIDARAGGACVLNISGNDSGAHVGILLDEKKC